MGQKCCAGDVRTAEASSEGDGDAPTVAPESPRQEADSSSCLEKQEAEKTAPETQAPDSQAETQAPESTTSETINLNHPPVDLDAPFDERDRALVQHTWEKASQLGSEQVGTILFEKIFELAPAAKQLFPFSFEHGSGRPDMLRHVTKVVETLDIAVNGLHDLDALKPVLQGLGLRHVGYKVLPEHYSVVCEALHETLAAALQEDATPSVKASWEKVLRFVRDAMIGDHYAATPPAATGAEDEAAATGAESAEVPKPEDAKVEEAPAPMMQPKASKGHADDHLTSPAPKSSKPTRTGSKPPDTKKSSKHKHKVEASGEKAKHKHKHKDKAEHAKASPSASPSVSQATTPSASPETKAKKMSSKERKAFWKSLSDAERAAQSTAVVVASLEGNLAEVTRLYEAFVDVSAEDPDGRTALRNAARSGSKNVVEFLVEIAAVSIDAARSDARGQETALHLACQFSKLEVAVYLVQKGANAGLKNRAGKTASDLTKNKEVAAWLALPSPKDTAPPTF